MLSLIFLLVLVIVSVLLIKWADNTIVEIPQNTSKKAESPSLFNFPTEKKIMEDDIKKALSLIKEKDTVSWYMLKQCIGSNTATNTVITVLIKAKVIFPTIDEGIYKINHEKVGEIDYEELGLSQIGAEQLPISPNPISQVSNAPTQMSGSTIQLPPSDAGGELRIAGFVFLLFSVIAIMYAVFSEHTTHEANRISYAICWLLLSLCCFVGAGLQKIAAYIQFYGTLLQTKPRRK